MNTKHTPGPWTVHGDISHLIGAEDEKAMIAEIVQPIQAHPEKWRRSIQECKANAALIAAAPDLLASLEQVTEWMRTHTGPSDGTHDTLVRAMAAIQTAGGIIR
jgi:hypothetical protein